VGNLENFYIWSNRDAKYMTFKGPELAVDGQLGYTPYAPQPSKGRTSESVRKKPPTSESISKIPLKAKNKRYTEAINYIMICLKLTKEL